MDKIFHEQQDGALCAQHCLNTLLQGPYFDAPDLSVLARQLDDAERSAMAKGDLESKEYLDFLKQPSSNVDDSGFFSVQVLSAALRNMGQLELVSFTSEACKESRGNPLTEQAYICHHHSHWFTLRRLGLQWFNLDSLLPYPNLVSDTYLSLLLEQLKQEGYSIFAVRGDIPHCDADDILLAHPVNPKDAHQSRLQSPPPLREAGQLRPPGARYDKSPSFDDVSSTIVEIDNDDLEVDDGDFVVDGDDEEYQLALAISASMQSSVQEQQGRTDELLVNPLVQQEDIPAATNEPSQVQSAHPVEVTIIEPLPADLQVPMDCEKGIVPHDPVAMDPPEENKSDVVPEKVPGIDKDVEKQEEALETGCNIELGGQESQN